MSTRIPTLKNTARWTSVKSNLPRPKDWKLHDGYIVTDGKRVWIEEEHPSWWNYRSKKGREFDGVKVTHWMERPVPPVNRSSNRADG